VTPESGEAKPFHLASCPCGCWWDLVPRIRRISVAGVAMRSRLAAAPQIGLRPTRLYSNTKIRSPIPRSSPSARCSVSAARHDPGGGRHLSCSVQLVGADGIELWHRPTMNPRRSCRIAGSVAEHVASALKVNLSPPERARPSCSVHAESCCVRLVTPRTRVAGEFHRGQHARRIGFLRAGARTRSSYALAGLRSRTSARG